MAVALAFVRVSSILFFIFGRPDVETLVSVMRKEAVYTVLLNATLFQL